MVFLFCEIEELVSKVLERGNRVASSPVTKWLILIVSFVILVVFTREKKQEESIYFIKIRGTCLKNSTFFLVKQGICRKKSIFYFSFIHFFF
jgi:hypothetical protein